MANKNFRVDNVLDKSLRGWLPVTSNNGKKYEIFYSTAVQCEIPKKLKEFKIIEGFHKLDNVSIDFQKINPRLFVNYVSKGKIGEQSLCLIFVDLEANKLIYNSLGMLHELNIQANNLKPGKYLILFPDRRHTDKISIDYLNESNLGSRFAETWFPLVKGRFEFQYLHYGSYSNGCVTVISDGKEWTNLYSYIIKSRYINGAHGVLFIFDNKQRIIEFLSHINKKK